VTPLQHFLLIFSARKGFCACIAMLLPSYHEPTAASP
jgi:hypothetical protein